MPSIALHGAAPLRAGRRNGEADETVTFAVTAMGPAAHEFMVGPAAAVAAGTPGTPEIADIGMMETRTLTYVFGEEPSAPRARRASRCEVAVGGGFMLAMV